MKIATVLINAWWRASIDFDGYAEALRDMGHEMIMVCHANLAGVADFPVIETNAQQQEDPAFWKSLKIDVAMVWSWLRGSGLVKALRKAGVKVILRADSDGIASDAVFPWQAWQRAIVGGRHWWNKPGLARYFLLHRLLGASRRDHELIETIRAADAVAVETETARLNLAKIMSAYDAEDLTEKMSVVPHSVRNLFLKASIPAKTADRMQIFCGGRWDDCQKDAPLLGKTLQRLLKAHANCEVVICGPGAKENLERPFQNEKRIIVMGAMPFEQVMSELGRSKILLSSSRWETQPVGSLEALCMGCSIVAPPIPGFADMPEGGRFGTLSHGRNAKALAEAALKEIQCWDAGHRDPGLISRTWRSRVSNRQVVADLLALIDK